MTESHQTKYSELYKKDRYYYHGYYWSSLDLCNAMKEFEHCECYEDDIWVDTYPKSGTVWVRTIVLAIMCKGDADLIKQEVERRNLTPMELLPKEIRKACLNLPSPRLLITHSPYSIFPPQAITKKNKVIYVARNPKDAAVSFYHFHRMNKSLGLYQGTWNQFFPYYIAGEVSYGSWFDHVINWWEESKKTPNILFLKFEDLKKDLQQGILKISQFLEHSLEDDVITAITKYCEFTSMKNNPVGEFLENVPFFNSSISSFLRKGEVGDWKNYFTEEENKEFDDLFQKRMKNCDLTLEFEI